MVAQIDKKYSQQGYRKVIRRLISYFFFEGRPHTTKGQWFNPVVFTFLSFLKTFPGSPTITKPIFITGLGRSGTTILGKLLSIHPDVGFLNEPKAIWKIIDPRHDINGDYTKTGGKYYLTSSDVTDQTRTAAYRIFARYLKIIRTSRLVDKYPELIFRVDYLLKLFPNAKIIFIIRNGIDATHSINNWSARLGKTTTKGTEDWWGRNDIKWDYLTQQIIKNDPAYKMIAPIINSSLDHTNRAAIEWIITMRIGMQQVNRYPDHIITIKYEELINSPDTQIKKLLSKCDLDYDKSVFNYARSVLYQTQTKQWPKLHPQIENLFVKTMKKLNYPTPENKV